MGVAKVANGGNLEQEGLKGDVDEKIEKKLTLARATAGKLSQASCASSPVFP